MELLVVAGADAGSRFTLEGDAVLIGRGEPETGQVDAIRLTDMSISRRHAWIRREGGASILEHVAGASNPTRVNGAPIARARLAVGDRIELGRVVIEVHARAGLNLSGPGEATAPPSGPTNVEADAPLAAGPTSERTELRPMQLRLGELVVVRGPAALVDARFPLPPGGAQIGRGDGVQIRIPEAGVSRIHAELVVEGQALVLIPRSQTNPTLVNGFAALGRAVLADGDLIQLADQVVLRLSLSPPPRAASERAGAKRAGARESGRAAPSALIDGMARKLDLEREIESYKVMGSFLDVDVVASRGMKGEREKPEHIVVSFERFRAFVAAICGEFAGQVLNSNGDELMCFFERAGDAVRAGSAVLARLDEFNRTQNLLSRPFRFRLGIHTGLSLVDLEAGVAYSEVLDLAGHIQKLAEPDTLLISRATLDALSEPIEVTEIPDPRGESGVLYRVDRDVRSDGASRPGGTQIL